MNHLLQEYKNQYKNALLEDVVPFWERHSFDRKYGGYFTCLDREGKVFDTDKFMWLQGRQVWTFAMLYNRVEPKEEWLQIAKNGIDFLKKFGSDDTGNFYFSVDRKGIPLVQPYNIFSDCFAALAFSQYALAAGDEEAKEMALSTFQNIQSRQHNPKGKYEKTTGNRPLKSFALPMILSNMVLEMKDILPASAVTAITDQCVHEVMEVFLDPHTGLVFEQVGLDGSRLDTYEGRLINPGHGIEAMWFIMDIARQKNDKQLIDRTTDTLIRLLEYGWDAEFGGIFYFMDAKGAPPLQLEWDQKLWWVHLEALVGLSKAYTATQRQDVWEWYEKVHQYTWRHFPDPAHGEWYGYLNRQGQPFITLKGSKWKGCYHLPRALYECWQSFATL